MNKGKNRIENKSNKISIAFYFTYHFHHNNFHIIQKHFLSNSILITNQKLKTFYPKIMTNSRVMYDENKLKRTFTRFLVKVNIQS